MSQREAYELDIPYLDDGELADIVETTIEESMSQSERSRWAASHRLGVSDIGHCFSGETEVPTRSGIVPIPSSCRADSGWSNRAAWASGVSPFGIGRRVPIAQKFSA